MVFFAFLVAFGFLAAFLVLFFAAFGIVRLVTSQGTWIDADAEQPPKDRRQHALYEWLVCSVATLYCAHAKKVYIAHARHSKQASRCISTKFSIRALSIEVRFVDPFKPMARKAAKKAAKKATKKAVKKSTKKKKAKKPKKAKKTKKRKAKRVSKVAKGSKRAQRSQVFRGKKEKTASGLSKDKLTKNKSGKIVSKAASARAKKNFQKRLGGWNAAVAKARKALGCKGFVAIKKGSALYNKAKGFYGKGSPKK